MTKTPFLLTLIVTALASMSAHAQRVFVSGQGSDSNPCTVTQPCRNLQQAYNSVPANGEIDVLDPAGYGPLTITHGISIQGHGWASITQAASGFPNAAITISVTTSDPVSLNGLLLDGAGTGDIGIHITSGRSVQILNSVVRHFGEGIRHETTTNGANLLVEDTVMSDNTTAGIDVETMVPVKVVLSRITANNNGAGVELGGVNDTTIANSVLSNNGNTGVMASGGVVWLSKMVISGSMQGIFVTGSTVKSYGDNYIGDNATPVFGGSLTPVSTQ
jgi:hypothetical protein